MPQNQIGLNFRYRTSMAALVGQAGAHNFAAPASNAESAHRSVVRSCVHRLAQRTPPSASINA